MRSLRASPALLAIALLGLTASHCVIPWLASAEAHNCCAQGGCHATMRSDDCCLASNPDATRHYQPQTPVKVAMTTIELPESEAPRTPAAFAPVFCPRPPGSIPLLI